MSERSRHFQLFVAMAAFAGTAQAAVTVTFTQPDRYADVGLHRAEAPDVLKELERHLQRLGATHLESGQALSIEVLDIDLAGEERFHPRAGGGLRILRGGADWPSVRLRYSIESAGKAGERREETVSDMNYLMRPIRQHERLAYEKRMLEEWFKGRFGSRTR